MYTNHSFSLFPLFFRAASREQSLREEINRRSEQELQLAASHANNITVHEEVDSLRDQLGQLVFFCLHLLPLISMRFVSTSIFSFHLLFVSSYVLIIFRAQVRELALREELDQSRVRLNMLEESRRRLARLYERARRH